MPPNKHLNIYVFLLKLAKEYIKESIDNFENRKNLMLIQNDYDRLHYSINYHMFAFSQLMYCIFERLKSDYPSDKKEIEKFFNKSGSAVYSTIIIANNIKHGKFDLTAVEAITIHVDQYHKPIKVIKHRADRVLTVNDKNSKKLELLLENKKLKGSEIGKIFEKSYEELIIFLDLKKYDC